MPAFIRVATDEEEGSHHPGNLLENERAMDKIGSSVVAIITICFIAAIAYRHAITDPRTIHPSFAILVMLLLMATAFVGNLLHFSLVLRAQHPITRLRPRFQTASSLFRQGQYKQAYQELPLPNKYIQVGLVLLWSYQAYLLCRAGELPDDWKNGDNGGPFGGGGEDGGEGLVERMLAMI